MVVSPCISICKTDPVTGYCYGCGRTNKEKIIWKEEETSDTQKEQNLLDIQKNPLTWLDTMLNAVEHMNFFEGRATEYSKASTQGTWAEAFS